MRPSVIEFVLKCSVNLPIAEPIYEFGSYQVPGHDGYANLRCCFPGKKYVGADIRNGDGVDVIMDMCNTFIPDESVGTVLSLDTLEHVEYLRKAIDEMYRILKPDGIIIISSVMHCPIHDSHDYWRFTPEGFESLLNQFQTTYVKSAGNPRFPHTVLGVACKGKPPEGLGRKVWS